MKKLYILLFVFNFYSFSITAQNNTKIIQEIRDKDCEGDFDIPDDQLNKIYSQACLEKSVSYSDGFELLQAFISNNFKVDKNLEYKKGRIFIEFVVEKDGTLSNYKVIRDVGFDSGQEAIRVLKLTKGWIPASHKGKTLRTTFSIPISIFN